MKLALSLLLLSGCVSNALPVAQHTTALIAAGGNDTDTALSAAYTVAAKEALAESESLEEYHEAMGPWDLAVNGVVNLFNWLGVTYDALSVWEASEDRTQYDSVAPCLRDSVFVLDGLVSALPMEKPPRLRAARYQAELIDGDCGL